jgi:hypothetical protein
MLYRNARQRNITWQITKKGMAKKYQTTNLKKKKRTSKKYITPDKHNDDKEIRMARKRKGARQRTTHGKEISLPTRW